MREPCPRHCKGRYSGQARRKHSRSDAPMDRTAPLMDEESHVAASASGLSARPTASRRSGLASERNQRADKPGDTRPLVTIPPATIGLLARKSILIVAMIGIASLTECANDPCSKSKDSYREGIFAQNNHTLSIRFYPPQSITLDRVTERAASIDVEPICIGPSERGMAISKTCYFVKFPSDRCLVDAENQISSLYQTAPLSIYLPLPEYPCDCDQYWKTIPL
jgi:hypothetical protein